MAILGRAAIRSAIAAGEIEVDPFDEQALQPVSVDLRLGHRVLIYESWYTGNTLKDVRREQPTSTSTFDRLTLEPGRLYLMHTLERVWTSKYAPRIEGKSSIGRLGIWVHVSAGFGDPGFDGQWTLEVACIEPVTIETGMKICQMSFHEIVGNVEQYDGNYGTRGNPSFGPVASRSYKQFFK